MARILTATIETNRVGLRAWLDGEGDLDELTTALDRALRSTSDHEGIVILVVIDSDEDDEDSE